MPENEKIALGTRILASLVNSGRYMGIERSSSFLAEVERELVKQHSGAVDDGQISELGKQFGVKYVCIAAITPAFGAFQVSARIVNVETAEVAFIGESSSLLQSMDEMTRVSDEVVGIMFGGQTQSARESKPEPTSALVPESPPVPVAQAAQPQPAEPKQGMLERVQAAVQRDGQQRAEKKMLKKERLEQTTVKKRKYGVNLSLHQENTGGVMFDVGGTGVFLINKKIQFAPQVNFRFGYYDYYHYNNTFHYHDEEYGEFFGVSVPLLFQFSTDYRRRIALFAEGGAGFEWLIDNYDNSVFNGAIIVGGGVAFWRCVHLDIVKLSIGTTYISIATGLRVVF